MPFSFHSHSGEYCAHAHGTLRQVIDTAVGKGFRVFGLSEHMPRYRTQDLYPDEIAIQRTPEHLQQLFPKFIQEARQLRTEYKNRIRLLIGLESELIYPSMLDDVQDLIKRHNLDYIVGSVHHVEGIPIDYDIATYQLAENAALKQMGGEGTMTPTEAIFLRYFDLQFEMLQRLKPAIVGHFDLVRLFRPNHPLSEACWQKIKRNVAFVVEYGGLFELNSRAWKKGLHGYPFDDILQYIMSIDGSKLTICDDSHGPKDVGLHYSDLYRRMKRLNINTIYFLDKDSMDIDDDKGSVVVKRLDNCLTDPFWNQFSQ